VTPYYSHAGIQIFLGDCREVLPTLGRFDLLLTDPPYGTGGNPFHGGGNSKGGAGWRSRRKSSESKVAGDAGHYDPKPDIPCALAHVFWGAHNYATRLPTDSRFWLAWDRKAGRGPYGVFGDFDLAWVSGHTLQATHVFRHAWAGLIRDSENAERSLHPTQKPVALMRWCLGFFPEARTVVDPYMGSGPVARACKDAGLTYVGIEIEERYCEVSAKRLAQEVLFGAL
jgi:DNA modification methylase